ncbi:outer membrane beta-barrel protein [uncultured Rhodoblastus sp.]|uniref:outer membrane protein n=1 Tax=uncultured Rhodoblastus sp. TaxID=543037 RepID=UPI0025E66778|nr:outer membrane beta-barrel protein [uncultured Rhodoblastus sp.]
MGRIEALILASVAAIAGSQTVGGGARAADLLPPAPPIEEPLRGAIVEETGFYLRGDLGVANANASNLQSTYRDGQTVASLSTIEGPASVGDPLLLGLGVGYKFNPWLRADVTGEYRNSINYRASSTYQWGDPSVSPCDPTSGVFCGDEYTGQIKTALFLANGYIDVGTWGGFTPYVGGGVGFAAYQVSGLKDISLYPGAAFGFANNNNGTNFAWALTAGVAYRLSPNLLLDVGYRYVNMGTFNTGTIACNNQTQFSCHFETQHFNVASNDLRVGLRWMPAAVAYAEPPVRARY